MSLELDLGAKSAGKETPIFPDTSGCILASR
jgi:hypothetical protein